MAYSNKLMNIMEELRVIYLKLMRKWKLAISHLGIKLGKFKLKLYGKSMIVNLDLILV